MTVVSTIILSVVFHGISANPLAKALGSRMKKASGGEEAGG
jgi:NhaP-type Na+/H+ or K+/H+ antiporter